MESTGKTFKQLAGETASKTLQMLRGTLTAIWEQIVLILAIYLKFVILALLVYAIFAWYVTNFDQPAEVVEEVVRKVEEL